MTYQQGDVVQVINSEAIPASGSRPAYPHPHFGMIGTVADIRHLDKIGVFFCTGVKPDKITGLPGQCFYFQPREITKVGVAAVKFNWDKINLIGQEIRDDLLKSINEENGTSFTTMEEWTEHYRNQDKNED